MIDLEGHGREAAGGMDLSRTVGWFTSVFPVRLDVGAISVDEALAGGAAAGRALKQVKEQLRAVPGRGLGYGLLRYVNGETAGQLAGYAERQIGFNYLGRFATGGEGAGDWSIGARDRQRWRVRCGDADGAPAGSERGHGGRRNRTGAECELELGGIAAERGQRCGSLAEAWQLALEGLVRHVEQPGAGGHTPSDFPLVKLSQAQIEELEKLCPEVEEILPLSPLQEGLVFHALYEDVGADVYTVQLAAELAGGLDAGRMRRAAEALLRRHGNLRVVDAPRRSGAACTGNPARSASAVGRDGAARADEGGMAGSRPPEAVRVHRGTPAALQPGGAGQRAPDAGVHAPSCAAGRLVGPNRL